MPLPVPATGAAWPPKPFGPAFDQYAVNAAWYEGDIDQLNRIYRGEQVTASGNERMVNGRLYKGGLRGLRDRWFNGAPVEGPGQPGSATRLHAPLATNVAALDADLIVSEPANVHLVKDGNTIQSKVQEAIDLTMNTDLAQLTLRRGVEWGAGVGGFAMTWAWQAGINDDLPWLQVHAADTIVPTYTQGWLTSITVFDTYPCDGDRYLRHLMSHDPGSISHGLYLGGPDTLGNPIPFTDPKVAEYAHHLVVLGNDVGGIVSNGGTVKTVATGTKLLTAAFVPNKDTIRFRREGILSFLGRATLEGGAESFLDAHDETWSSLMRDLKIGRARMFVDQSMLEGLGPGRGAYFDDYSELFTGLTSMSLGDGGLSANLSAQQFDIRTTDHLTLLQAQTAEVLQFAGLSQSSYGESQSEVAQTATDSVDRAKKSERTRDNQTKRLGMALKHMTRAGVELIAALPGLVNPGKLDPKELQVEFPEVSQIDPEKQARVINYLHGANALSTFLSVKMQHPDWETTAVQEETDRILQESQTVGVDPFAITDQPAGDAQPGSDQSGVNDANQNDQAGTAAPQGN